MSVYTLTGHRQPELTPIVALGGRILNEGVCVIWCGGRALVDVFGLVAQGAGE